MVRFVPPGPNDLFFRQVRDSHRRVFWGKDETLDAMAQKFPNRVRAKTEVAVPAPKRISANLRISVIATCEVKPAYARGKHDREAFVAAHQEEADDIGKSKDVCGRSGVETGIPMHAELFTRMLACIAFQPFEQRGDEQLRFNHFKKHHRGRTRAYRFWRRGHAASAARGEAGRLHIEGRWPAKNKAQVRVSQPSTLPRPSPPPRGSEWRTKQHNSAMFDSRHVAFW